MVLIRNYNLRVSRGMACGTTSYSTRCLRQPTEDCSATLQNFFARELDIREDVQFARAHRMGKRLTGKARPIVAKFELYKHRDAARMTGPKLAGKRFGICEQIQMEWQDKRKALLPFYKDAKKRGKRTMFVGNKLLVERHFITPNTPHHHT